MKRSLSRGSMMQVLALAATVFICLGFPSQIAAQQGGTVRYFYDDNGRLIRVALPSGETATYEYDPAGNFTAIKRFSNDVLQVLDFSPKVGGQGDSVTFFGTGFSSGVNQVSFNGAIGRLISADATTVIAEVPEDATTGPVTITTTRGSATTSDPFTIRSIRVHPSSADLAPGAGIQFTAVVRVAGDPGVRWSVNGVDGGNSSVGVITATGFYTAPSLPPFRILVRAASAIDALLFGEAQVTVRSFDFDLACQSNGVSVARQPAPAPPDKLAAASAGLSVQREPSQSSTPQLAAVSGAVSVTKTPFISSISPAAVSRGASVPVTIAGANLTGAATFRFVDLTGAIDSNLAVSNAVVSADGTTLTLTLDASASAMLGRHLVIVSTPNGSSALFDTGKNTIEIAP